MVPRDRLGCCIYLVYLLCCSTRLSLTSHPGDNNACAIRANGTVDCRHRALTTIPNDTFPSNTIKLDLSFNDLKNVPGHAFHTLRNLTWLDLSFNYITHLGKHAFVNLSQLVYLNINSNDILLANQSYHPELFVPLVNLQILHMEANRCAQMTRNSMFPVAVAALFNLRELYTDLPTYVKFTHHFQNLNKLTTLSSSGYSVPRKVKKRYCCVKKLFDDTFEPFRNISVKHFRLAHSCLGHVEKLTFEPFQQLSSFDLTGNRKVGLMGIWESLYGLRNQNITFLSLKSCNDFVEKTHEDFIPNSYNTRFLRTICVDYLDLSDNFIYFQVEGGIYLSKPECLRRFDMSVHMSRPDLLLHRLYRFFPEIKILNISYLLVSPSFNGLVNTQKCRNRASDTTNDPKFRPVSMDLSYMPMTCNHMFPQFASLKLLNLTGWNCSDFRTNIFANLHNVTDLSIGQVSYGMQIQMFNKSEPAFRKMESLERIDLSKNEITSLPDNLFQANHRLISLNLFGNKLSGVPLKVFETAPLLRLDVSRNVLQYLTSSEINTLLIHKNKHPEFQMKLGSNPFVCNCKSLEFLQWLNTTDMVADYGPSYVCTLTDGSQTDIVEFMKTFKDFSIACVSRRWLYYGIGGSLLVVILLVASVIYCRYRWNIHYWFYTNCRPSPDMLPERRFDYDVFVCYNHNDCHWVYQTLRPHLEDEERGLRLCPHHRDFPAGVEIHQNIVDAINNSRKVVLVVSNSFVQSTWGEYEIEMANMKSVQEGRTNVIICVLVEKVPVQCMPKTLLNLWHRVTFLEWPDNPREEAQFWERLMKAVD